MRTHPRQGCRLGSRRTFLCLSSPLEIGSWLWNRLFFITTGLPNPKRTFSCCKKLEKKILAVLCNPKVQQLLLYSKHCSCMPSINGRTIHTSENYHSTLGQKFQKVSLNYFKNWNKIRQKIYFRKILQFSKYLKHFFKCQNFLASQNFKTYLALLRILFCWIWKSPLSVV